MRARGWVPPSSVLAAAVVASPVGLLFDPFTWPMRVATALALAAVAGAAVRRGWHRREPPYGSVPVSTPRSPLFVWAVLILATTGFQLAVYFSSPRAVYPTLSSLAAILFGWRLVRSAAFALWIWLGWYLVER